jgi:hypothetical protein
MHRDKRRSVVELLERRFLMSATYNRTAAVAFATQYWDEVLPDGYFWTTTSACTYYGAGVTAPTGTGLDDGIGDDCAHFVSSCIGSPIGGGAGGLAVTQPFAGNSNKAYAAQYGDPSAPGIDQWLISSGDATLIASGSVTSTTVKNAISQMQPGDVIGYNWENESSIGDVDHTVMYLGNGMIAAHAASEFDVAWNSFGSSGYTVFLIHITVPSAASPATPTNSLPANNAVVTTTTPTLSASAFSESGATQAAAEWQIFNGTTLVYDSGTDTTDKTTLTVPTGKLSSGNTYTWDVRYEDNSGNWSSYSTATSFTVTVGPYTPVNSSPANNASLLNPVTLSASAFSDTLAGTTHTATEWLVKNSSSTTVFDSGTDTTDLSSITVPSADLVTGQTYSWQVRYEDNSGNWSTYSTATSFTMATPSLLTLPAASAYYLQDSADGQSLNIWDATTDTGTPAQSIQLRTISKIIINGASAGSNITLDFSNGNISPQNRVTVLGGGSSANNVLNVLGSNGNDAVSYFDGQFTINATLVAYSSEGAFGFTPGTGTDTFSLSGGTLNLGATASGALQLSSLSVASGATLNIGSDIVNLFYTAGNDPESTIQALITSGYNNNLWTGTGITSSTVAANSMTSAVGYYDTGSQVTFRATWKGDANCDGVVNSDDLSIMLLGQAQQKTNWSAGNFNYDTQINADDSIIFIYALAYSGGRNYSSVFSPGAVLGSSAQMSQLLT